ncbi:hypothetical protein [Flexibacter flexilis]|nr:hypothetical protein [Flexibacter flexilis]
MAAMSLGFSYAQVPTLSNSVSFGDAASQISTGTAVNPANGTTYSTGYYWGSPSFGTNVLPAPTGGNGGEDRNIYILKLTAPYSSSSVVWAQSIEGDSVLISNSIAYDAAGDVYVTRQYQRCCNSRWHDI